MICLSFAVVLYSMYSLYAVIKMVLFDQRGCHVQQELEAKVHSGSTDHWSLLKHRNFAFALSRGGG